MKGIPVPVIDLFAGPGGLGEGFSSLSGRKFKIALSIENDPGAHRTLRLRAFYRQFNGKVPEEYYDVLKGKMSDQDMFVKKNKFNSHINRALEQAENEVRCLTLGREPAGNIDFIIKAALHGTEDWVLIGGPPCQAYSVAGRSRNMGIKDYKPEKDDRHFLYREYLRVISAHRPAVFIMENVKGLLSSSVKGELIFQQMLRDLRNPSQALAVGISGCRYRIHSISYETENQAFLPGMQDMDPHHYVVHCEKYGIPQARHRVILTGIREDLWDHELEKLDITAEPVNMKEVLKDLPILRCGISKEEDSEEQWKKLISNSPLKKTHVKEFEELTRKHCLLKMNRGAEFIKNSDFQRWVTSARMKKSLADWYKDSRLRGVCNSSTRAHIKEDIERYLFTSLYALKYGRSPRLTDFPEKLLPNHKNAGSGNFNDRFRVQVADLPSTTITSHISKDGHYYIHPDPVQCRSLTVREAARLQTFPDNYFFCGYRTQQYTQVGNAVPPMLAIQIAEIIYNFLRKVERV